MDLGIRSKMSRIPNTVLKTVLVKTYRAFFRQWRVRFPHVTIQRSAKPRNKIALRAGVLRPRFLLVSAVLVCKSLLAICKIQELFDNNSGSEK